ncbi:hypothetical protein KAX29_00025 [candidate division WOR-3 bacterium]|nr:hypothetical protein [candidate division WOR-3 bacterium]
MNKITLTTIGILVIAIVLLGVYIHKPFVPTEEQLSERLKIPVTPSPKPTNLSQVKVASQYRRVTDGVAIGRSMDDVRDIFKETQTEFIF